MQTETSWETTTHLAEQLKCKSDNTKWPNHVVEPEPLYTADRNAKMI